MDEEIDNKADAEQELTKTKKALFLLRSSLDKYLKGERGPEAQFSKYLAELRNENPTSVYCALFDSIFAFFAENKPYASEISSPEKTCYCANRVNTQNVAPFLKVDEITTTYKPYHNCEAWKKHNGHLFYNSKQRIFEDRFSLIRLWIDDPNEDLAIDFSRYFVGLVMNQPIQHTLNTAFGQDIRVAGGVDNGIINCSAKVNNNAYRYDKGHRYNEDLCVADNIMEFMIPYIKETIHSPNCKRLVDLLGQECMKYSNSWCAY